MLDSLYRLLFICDAISSHVQHFTTRAERRCFQFVRIHEVLQRNNRETRLAAKKRSLAQTRSYLHLLGEAPSHTVFILRYRYHSGQRFLSYSTNCSCRIVLLFRRCESIFYNQLHVRNCRIQVRNFRNRRQFVGMRSGTIHLGLFVPIWFASLSISQFRCISVASRTKLEIGI